MSELPDNVPSGSPRRGWRKVAQALLGGCALLLAIGVFFKGNHLVGSGYLLFRWPLMGLLGGASLYLWKKSCRRPAWVGAVTVLLLLGETLWAASRRERPPEGPGSREAGLRLLSYNLLSRGGEPLKTLEQLSQGNFDIALFQEVGQKWDRKLREALAARFPYVESTPHCSNGLAIYSRYPLSNLKVLYNGRNRHFAQCVNVQAGHGEWTVCNVHFSSPAKAFSKGVNALSTLWENAGFRAEEWRRVREELKHRGTPLAQIVGGDFNTLFLDPLYEEIRRDYFDVCRELQFFPEGTFPHVGGMTSWPRHLIRIDYVFAKGPLIPTHCEVTRAGGSDHNPVLVEWEWLMKPEAPTSGARPRLLNGFL